MGSRIKTEVIKSIVIILLLISIQSCADLSTSPEQNSDLTNADLKIKITSPVNNAQLLEGSNEIIYTIAEPYSLKFIELYINDTFNRNYPPNQDGTAPQIFFNFDSTYVGKVISLYLVYYDNNNTSQKSNLITNVSVKINIPIPYKPYNITLINFNDGSCNIGWKDSSKYVEKYQVWKKIGITGDYFLLNELSGNTNNVNDYNLGPNIVYFYKVRGVNSSGISAFSDEVNTAGIYTSGNLYPPSDLSAIQTSPISVQLKWKDNSDNENYFVVERSTDNIKFINIALLSRNTISYQDSASGLLTGGSYYYRIKAYSNSDSAFSNIAMVKILSGILQPPINLTAAYNKDIGVIELRWDNSDNNTVYFDIERKIDDNNFQFLRRIDASNTLFLDFDILKDKNYKYRVRSYDLNRYSEYSNEVTVSTFN